MLNAIVYLSDSSCNFLHVGKVGAASSSCFNMLVSQTKSNLPNQSILCSTYFMLKFYTIFKMHEKGGPFFLIVNVQLKKYHKTI